MALRTIPKLLLAIPAAATFYLFVVWLLSRKLGIAESKSGPEKCSWTGEDALRRAQFCKSSHLSGTIKFTLALLFTNNLHKAC